MDDPSVLTIFEAAFHIDDYVTRADIITRTDNGWHLIEVKSSLREKPEYIDDATYTAMVLTKAGIDLTKISLLVMSVDYRLGMDNRVLFAELDCTSKVQQQLATFLPYWDDVMSLTLQDSSPLSDFQLQCKGCEHLFSCFDEVENHIFEIPRLSQKKFEKLKSQKIFIINNIPDGFDLTENQLKVVRSVKADEIIVEHALKEDLDAIVWPAYYLDFETVKTALPLYSDIPPHAQITTQYSVHKCSSVGTIDDHFAYLADPLVDSRRILAEKLIKDTIGEGSIIVYSSFEKTRINELKALYPDIAPSLEVLINRLVDLEAIIRRGFYHPKFQGRTSIKYTLPSIVPEMSYENLEISDGMTASVHFAYMAQGRYQPEEAMAIRNNLLEYCKQDTLGMVKLHKHLAEYNGA